MIGLLIGLALGGLIVGALGRLAVPGPNPMSIGKTIGIGLVGSFVSGLIVRAFTDQIGASLLLSVLVTAAIVYFLQKRDA